MREAVGAHGGLRQRRRVTEAAGVEMWPVVVVVDLAAGTYDRRGGQPTQQGRFMVAPAAQDDSETRAMAGVAARDRRRKARMLTRLQ